MHLENSDTCKNNEAVMEANSLYLFCNNTNTFLPSVKSPNRFIKNYLINNEVITIIPHEPISKSNRNIQLTAHLCCRRDLFDNAADNIFQFLLP